LQPTKPAKSQGKNPKKENQGFFALFIDVVVVHPGWTSFNFCLAVVFTDDGFRE